MHLTELDRSVRTMPAILREQASRCGDHPFLMFDDRSFTFSRADALVDDYATGLRNIGVERSTHVGIMMENSPEYLWVWLALGRLGAVVVPLNTAYKGDLLRHALSHANVCVVLIGDEFLERLEAIESDLPSLHTIVVNGPGAGPDTLYGRNAVVLEDLPQAGDVDELPDVFGHDLATILFTSGTTGPSKGAMLSHSLWADAALSTLEIRDVREDDVFYAVSPMFHGAPWSPSINCALATALPVGLDVRFSVSRFWDRVRHYSATQLFTMSPMHDWIYEAPPLPSDRDNPARVWGPLPMSPERVDAFKQRFGIEHLWFSYGQSEASMLTCTDVRKPHKPGSSGWKRSGVELAVVDDLDNVLPTDHVGELVVRPLRPHAIMDGYWDRADANARVFRNLWYHTGDFCRIDSDGEVFFVDRKADYVRIRSENVSSFEVEEAAVLHPDVLEAAAYAVSPPGSAEEELMLAVVARPNSTVVPCEIAEHCAKLLPKFAILRFVEAFAEFPRTPTDKVRKCELRQRGVGATTWDSNAER